MPLDLLELSTQVRQMGELLAERRVDEQRRLRLLDEMLADYCDRWEELAELAEAVQERVAVPTGPLDERIPPPERPAAYTAMATDGAEIDPDRHGGSGDFYLLNVRRLPLPHGQPQPQVQIPRVSRLPHTAPDPFTLHPPHPPPPLP